MYNLIKRIKDSASVTLSTSAAEILPADNNRGHALVQNLDSSIVVWVGNSDVAANNGVRLAPGQIWHYHGRQRLFAVAASGTPSVGLTVETVASNMIKRLTVVPVTVDDDGTLLAPRNTRRHRVTIQNLSASSVSVGTEAGAGVVLPQYGSVDFLSVAPVYARSGGTNEVQTVTLADATGGTFTLTFAGEETDAIAYNATAATVQTRLRALDALGNTDVSVTGSTGGPYTVTFTGAYANTNVPALVADAASLTHASLTPTVTVATNPQGASGQYSFLVISQLT